jgi:ABC-type uncharacterized transport system auxiliary subunit
LALAGLLAGCFGGSGKTPYVRQYVLEYPPPHGGARSTVEATARVERFSADRAYQGQAMLYRQGPFLRESYPLQRWRVSPADMVTEFLRRDLRGAGLFRAVVSNRDAEDVRFTLSGGVEEFLETGEGAGRKALLVATVTLLDDAKKETAGWVVFQKTYRVETGVEGEGGAAMAAAMSAAMAELSKRVIAEIAAALR